MFNAQQIKQHMVVVDTQGQHIGTVDQVEDYVVELTREGFADGLHHFVPLAAVRKIDGNNVIVEPGHATTIEAVAGAVGYAHSHPAGAQRMDPIFGTSGHGTGMGGSGIGD